MLTWKEIIEFANTSNPTPQRRVEKTLDQWPEILTPQQFIVTRQAGTEPAHSTEMCGLFEPGQYNCVCCDAPLFDSKTKYESGTGWPSFDQPITDAAIAYHIDRSHAMSRVETTCNTCDSHLGHVFPDGPEPSGLRYCMNALALVKADKY